MRTRIWGAAESGRLVDDDAERPDVRLNGEREVCLVSKALGRSPLLREALVAGLVGVAWWRRLGAPERAREAEVGDLHEVLLAHEDVGGAQVAVDAAPLLEEPHPRRNLHPHGTVTIVPPVLCSFSRRASAHLRSYRNISRRSIETFTVTTI